MASAQDKNIGATALQREIEHYTRVLAGGASGRLAEVYLCQLAEAHAALTLITERRPACLEDLPIGIK